MSSRNELHQRAAELLAKPFSKGRGRGSAPLSFRILPDGGMVVITADGRKLWFSADEVNAVIEGIHLEPSPASSPSQTAKSRFKPSGLLPPQEAPSAYSGMPQLIVLPPDKKRKSSKGEIS